MERKSEQYLKMSDRAISNIQRWPKWMQDNLNPPKVKVTESKSKPASNQRAQR